MEPERTRKVVVAMSGGVDSSVAAALLAKEGYDVTGMMLRLWSEAGKEDLNRCCTPDAMMLARRVAAKLGIPFYVIDVKEKFREWVVEAFIQGYLAGMTPNPCLVCNRQIRWGLLLQQALSLGAEWLATGHYARIARDEQGRFLLLRALDAAKDQSYVLSVLGQQDLRHTLLPIGNYTKPQVRELARKFGLPVAERSESQDLCFLAGEDYRDFLVRHAPEAMRPGQIVNRRGEVLGEHQGLAFYTIGQRKGLGVASSRPLYVVDKDFRQNLLIVGPLEELGKTTLHAAPVNWVLGEPPAERFRAEVKIRYTATPLSATVIVETPQQVRVEFDQPVRDITPGQRAVFYQGDVVVGGGTIVSASNG
ncbi:tRNA 2-thiouridine(34) synthase MnmA [uncultured Thermanaerothrix sp.]|uniref:tRNA 2-thiouridine(34) synthase MnmA n=1 Tax=uncultured Thermanaerothrix sp. TaxID=1195149 RepID=UPI0026311249|nr:tRNA 2-thiouridine(34) synthase MnmA [uncultured Thermanaerothrix sp.]